MSDFGRVAKPLIDGIMPDFNPTNYTHRLIQNCSAKFGHSGTKNKKASDVDQRRTKERRLLT